MAWQGIFGVEEVALRFARAARRERLGGSFLFVGPNGIGKRAFAFALAKTLLCRRNFPENARANLGDPEDGASDSELLERFRPCEKCDCCGQFQWSADNPEVSIPTNPDFHHVRKPDDKSLLPLELLIGDGKSRSGLRDFLGETSYSGGRKIAVVDDADFFNVEGANALLKTLEEPPPNSLIILIGTSEAKQLPTIRSRCQIFRFKPLSTEALAEVLIRQGAVEDPDEARRVASLSRGSLEIARQVLDPALAEFQSALIAELSRERLRAVAFAPKTLEFIDGAGKEASAKRRRLQSALKGALDFYRATLVARESERSGGSGSGFGRAIAPVSAETALACVERTLTALEQVDRNANLPYIVESWLYDLAEATRRGISR
ncbi:MAG: hypothetical protein IJM30_00990 [Thermoguttaceae bacterium]|nr:hypothetical protein [Thermoguttaceae bacterium]MBQ9873020.1 hypothetical protein [Thermoguttaceae bacterium]